MNNKYLYSALIVGVITIIFLNSIMNITSKYYKGAILDLEIQIEDMKSEQLDLLEKNQTISHNLKDAQSKLRYLEKQLYGDDEDGNNDEPKTKVLGSRTTTTDTKVLLGTFEATAYTDDVASQGKWVGQTATGRKPQVGVIAVDPKVISLNTKLYVEGYGECVAGDVGGAIKGNRVDLFYDTAKECKTFGRQQLQVWKVNE